MRPVARPSTLPKPDRADAILCFDGGAEMGPYQAGIYDAIEHMGLDLGWILASGVGAVNAAIIVSNPPDRRLQSLYEFWARLGQLCRTTAPASHSALTGTRLNGPLHEILSDLIDPTLLARPHTRITIAANSERSHHPGIFDSERQSLSLAHLTSTLGALALHQERPQPDHAPRLSLMHSVLLPALARGHHTPSLGICVTAGTKRETYGQRIPTTASPNPERPAFHTAPDHASHGRDAAKSRLIRITVAALARPARPALAICALPAQILQLWTSGYRDAHRAFELCEDEAVGDAARGVALHELSAGIDG